MKTYEENRSGFLEFQAGSSEKDGLSIKNEEIESEQGKNIGIPCLIFVLI